MNNVLIDLGFIEIKWYSILIILGITIAYILISKETKKKGMKEDTLIDLVFYMILIGILGARLYYVLFNLDYYLPNFKEIFMIWNGGLAIHGAIIAGLIYLVIYTKKKNINLKLLIDILVVGLIIAQAIGRWGNFFNGEAYGAVVRKRFLESLFIPKFIIKGMLINGSYHHPTFLYESISSFICFIVLIIIRNKNIKTGTLTSIYLIWYGTFRFLIEGLRMDSLMLGPFRIAQCISIIEIIIGILYLVVSNKNNKLYKEEKF